MVPLIARNSHTRADDIFSRHNLALLKCWKRFSLLPICLHLCLVQRQPVPSSKSNKANDRPVSYCCDRSNVSLFLALTKPVIVQSAAAVIGQILACSNSNKASDQPIGYCCNWSNVSLFLALTKPAITQVEQSQCLPNMCPVVIGSMLACSEL